MARGGNGQLRDDELRAAISTVAGGAGFDVDDIVVRLSGGRRLVRVVVDSDNGVDLNSTSQLSREIATALDTEYDDFLGDAPYTLEVTSRGIGAPLTLPRHFRRAIGRLVTIVRTDGTAMTARIAQVGDGDVAVLSGGDGLQPISIPLAEITSAKVEAEFSPLSDRVREALAAYGFSGSPDRPTAGEGKTSNDSTKEGNDAR